MVVVDGVIEVVCVDDSHHEVEHVAPLVPLQPRALRIRPNPGLGFEPFLVWQRQVRLYQPGNQ